MKKLFMMAMMAVAATCVYAGDSDVLKQILSLKKQGEINRAIKENIDKLASDAERAKAYNYLVEVANTKLTKESTKVTQNQMAEQFKQGKVEPYDTAGLYNAAATVLRAAVLCNKYDQMPNEKGKVSPKYAKNNMNRAWTARTQLVNGGQWAAQQGDSKGVLKYWGAFLDNTDDPLFEGVDQKQKEDEKNYFGQVALFTARYAYQDGNMKKAKKYCDLAMRDPEQKSDALNLKLYIMKSDLKTQEDSLKYIKDLKKIYKEDPNNDVVLDNLYNMYGAMKDKEAQGKLLDDALAQNPNNFVALADKGMMAIADNQADEAVKYLRKAAEVKPDNALVWTYLGACLNVQAANAATPTEGKKIYQEAVEILDKAKSLDPDKQLANWGYNRYQAYYGLYGENDPKTKAAEAESH